MKSSSYTLWGIQFSLKPAFHLISEFQTFHYSYSIYLFSCFWQERESLTKIEEDEKILKNKLLKGATSYTYCLKKEAKIWVCQANSTDTSMGTDFAGRPRDCSSHTGEGAFSCVLMGCRREGKGQTQTLNHSCFPHSLPQQELFSAARQGSYFLTHPYAFC